MREKLDLKYDQTFKHFINRGFNVILQVNYQYCRDFTWLWYLSNQIFQQEVSQIVRTFDRQEFQYDASSDEALIAECLETLTHEFFVYESTISLMQKLIDVLPSVDCKKKACYKLLLALAPVQPAFVNKLVQEISIFNASTLVYIANGLIAFNLKEEEKVPRQLYSAMRDRFLYFVFYNFIALPKVQKISVDLINAFKIREEHLKKIFDKICNNKNEKAEIIDNTLPILLASNFTNLLSPDGDVILEYCKVWTIKQVSKLPPLNRLAPEEGKNALSVVQYYQYVLYYFRNATEVLRITEEMITKLEAIFFQQTKFSKHLPKSCITFCNSVPEISKYFSERNL
jgi:hypothetical protein